MKNSKKSSQMNGTEQTKSTGSSQPIAKKVSKKPRKSKTMPASKVATVGPAGIPALTMGVDVGNRYSHLCLLDVTGEVIERDRIATEPAAYARAFADRALMRVIVEAGTDSPWISRCVASFGHEVVVANPYKTRSIFESNQKDDNRDAEELARLGRLDTRLLHPIRHHSERVQLDRERLRARDLLMQMRTMAINHVRSAAKTTAGVRLPSCDADYFPKHVAKAVPESLRPIVSPLLELIGDLTTRIRASTRELEQIANELYPETSVMRQIGGVGVLTSLGVALAVEDPSRFKRNRDVGPFLGLTPKRDESGDTSRQLSITKAGDGFARRMLVNAAQYILGPFGGDSYLQRWGKELAKRGGKRSKKRAVVAVARKLAVLLVTLWRTGCEYDPMRNIDKVKVVPA